MMLNYMKSEWYRLTRGKEVYLMGAVLAGAVILMNLVLALSNRYIPDFRYGTFRFSLNTFTSMSFSMLLVGAFIGAYLYSDDIKNGVMKNAVAYGITRIQILLGKCIISLISAVLMLAAVLTVYVGSAYILLDHWELLPLVEMLKAVLAVFPCAVASLIFMIVLKTICSKDSSAIFWWALFFYLIPIGCFFIGLKVKPVEQVSEWMPYIFLKTGAVVTYSDYHCLWDTAEGMAKCIVAGVLGIIIFLAFGIWKAEKQEY